MASVISKDMVENSRPARLADGAPSRFDSGRIVLAVTRRRGGNLISKLLAVLQELADRLNLMPHLLIKIVDARFQFGDSLFCAVHRFSFFKALVRCKMAFKAETKLEIHWFLVWFMTLRHCGSLSGPTAKLGAAACVFRRSRESRRTTDF